MLGRVARAGGAIAVVAAVTWIALAVVLYLLFYRTVTDVYQKIGRNVLQVDCGRVVPNELIYTLSPGECRFANPEFDTRVQVDGDGFRNVPEHLGSGPVKVVVLGDSHALGWGVQQEEKLSSRLARDPRFAVRDLAMSSYGTARELLALKRHEPDAGVVVLQYCDNDRAENAEFLSNPDAFVANGPERARQYAAQMVLHRQAADRHRSLRWVLQSGLVALSATWRILGLPPRGPSESPQHAIKQEAALFASVLAHFKTELAGKTLIVFDSYPRRPRSGFAPAFRAALEHAGMANVIVVDLAGTLVASDYFHIDEHLRASGHAKVAARILAELDRSASMPTAR